MNVKPYLYDAFLCHNSKDKPLVEQIVEQLRARGIRCWLDKHELRPGKNWRDFVTSEWPRIASMVVCFGPNGISSGQLHEIQSLIPAADASQSILPIILPDVDVAIDAKALLPKTLHHRIRIDFRKLKYNPIDALIWGIRGESPFVRLSIGSYYKATEGLEDEALKSMLGDLIGKDHKPLSYLPGARLAIEKIFEDPENPENLILFHNGVSVPKAFYGPIIQNEGWNMDHIWPKAFGYSDQRHSSHLKILADLHNICPANTTYNSKRSAGFFYDRRLDTIEKNTEIIPSRQFDPRGVIARACLYMVVRYQGKNQEPTLILDERIAVQNEPHLGSLETLLYWNKLAPVTAAERKRNDLISELQGNRNPFVDRPEFADLIWYPI